MIKGKAGGCAGIFVSILLLILSIVFLFFTAGPVLSRVQYGVQDIFDYQPSEIQKNRFASIELLRVYDRIYTTYSTNDETGETEVDNYYYIVYYTADETLIIKTSPDTEYEDIVFSMLYGGSEYPTSRTVEGVFDNLTSDVKYKYEKWCKENDELENIPACDYILDCSNTFTGILITFIIACVVFLSVIVFWIVFIIIAAKGKNNAIPPAPQNTGYIPQQTNSTSYAGSTIPTHNNYKPVNQQYDPNSPKIYNDPFINSFNSSERPDAVLTQQNSSKSYNPYDGDK